VKQGLLSLAGIALAMAAAVPAHALTDTITAIPQATYNLAQAYPCTIGNYAAFPNSDGISDLRTWCGVNGPLLTAGAAPGVLCLARNGLALDVNCFAVVPTSPLQYGPCFVQAYRLIKKVPGSFKCPDVYGLPHFSTDDPPKLLPYTYFQYGTGVRTWWALNYTQPGTKFILEVVSVCRASPTVNGVLGPAVVHKDVWTWRMVASPGTLANLIEVMHGSGVSTLEAPCIIGEDMYVALKKAQQRLATASGTSDVGDAIFDMEALVVSNCLFVDVLDPLQAFPGAPQFGAPNIQPPGNLAQQVFIANDGSAIAGIIDTIENPCCCKLLVDLEWISISKGLVGQTPTLPVDFANY